MKPQGCCYKHVHLLYPVFLCCPCAKRDSHSQKSVTWSDGLRAVPTISICIYGRSEQPQLKEMFVVVYRNNVITALQFVYEHIQVKSQFWATWLLFLMKCRHDIRTMVLLPFKCFVYSICCCHRNMSWLCVVKALRWQLGQNFLTLLPWTTIFSVRV